MASEETLDAWHAVWGAATKLNAKLNVFWGLFWGSCAALSSPPEATRPGDTGGVHGNLPVDPGTFPVEPRARPVARGARAADGKL